MLITKRLTPRTESVAVPVLKPKLLRNVHALNREFLRLIEPPGTRSMGLGAELANGVRRLGEASRRPIAACGFTLFTLRLTDVKLWGTLCGSLAPTDIVPVGGIPESTSSQPADETRLLFVQNALFLAWHTVQVAPLAARLIFGAVDQVAELLRSLSVSSIQDLGLQTDVPLRARWAANECFWPDLVNYAEPLQAKELEMTHLLGAQLLAGDLGRGVEKT